MLEEESQSNVVMPFFLFPSYQKRKRPLEYGVKMIPLTRPRRPLFSVFFFLGARVGNLGK